MKIAHINLAKGFRGGERQTVILIEHLAKLDGVTQQYLLCRADSPMRAQLKHVRNLSLINVKHQLQGHFSINDADVVQAHDAKGVHWAWLQYQLFARPYVICRRIDNPVKDKFFNRLTYQTAYARIAISKIIEQQLIQRKWGKVTRIADAFAYLPHDPEQTKQLRAPFAKQFVIGHIGALSDHQKGQRVLLAAAERLQHAHPEMQFLFYGQGSDEQVLKAESKHLNNVHWQGFIRNIGDAIAMFDLFAFPSRMEGLGSTLLDVMYFNVPIIASNVGGIPDVIKHQQTGLLFANADIDALVSAILELYQCPEYAQKLAQNATEKLTTYAPEKMAKAYLNLYQQAKKSGQ